MKETKLIDSGSLKLYIETIEPEKDNMVNDNNLKPEINVKAELQDGRRPKFLVNNMVDGNRFLWYSPLDSEEFVESSRDLILPDELMEINTVEIGKTFRNTYDSLKELEEGKSFLERLKGSYSAPIYKQNPQEITLILDEGEGSARYGWEAGDNKELLGLNQISLFTSNGYGRESLYEDRLEDFLVETVPDNEYRTAIIYNLSEILEEAEVELKKNE